MKRKLISYDALQKIEAGSISNAVEELVGAEKMVADMLGYDEVNLHCYDKGDAYYETSDGTYVHAQYALDGNRIKLFNIEEVAVDTESEDKHRKDMVRQMVEALLNDDEPRAKDQFRRYLEMATPKMKLCKGRKEKSAVDKMADNCHMDESTAVAQSANTSDPKTRIAALKGSKGGAAQREGWKKRKAHKAQINQHKKSAKYKEQRSKVEQLKKAGHKRARIDFWRADKPEKKHMQENWLRVADNVLEYVDIMTQSPVLAEMRIQRDEVGNVVAATIPTTKLRNEGKLLALKYDTLKTDVKVMREKAVKLRLEENFQKLVAKIKRLNNISDQSELQEALSALVAQHPTVLYLTQDELSKTVSEALANVGATNYDDQICDFIAEGILRVAFNTYPERVNRLASLSNAPRPNESEDAFEVFQTAVNNFFPNVDEQSEVEMKAFEDLHEAFMEIRRESLASGYDELRQEANNYLSAIEGVLSGKQKPDLSLAEAAAAFLSMLTEGGLDMQSWEIVTKPYLTRHGEHPDMEKKARVSLSQKDSMGHYQDPAPVSDGEEWTAKDAEQMRNKAWGNVGGKDTYPELDNPYVPQEGKWTMPHDTGVDKDHDEGLAQWQDGGKTWPGLENPYVPQSVKRQVKSDNRVDDVDSRVGIGQTSDLEQKIS